MFKDTLARFALSSLMYIGGLQKGNPDHELVVEDASFVWRLFLDGGSLALGNAYMHGLVHAPRIDRVLSRLADSPLANVPNLDDLRYWYRGLKGDHQDLEKSKRVGKVHYDISSKVYELMLGPTMLYTSALGMVDGLPLDPAQERKVSRMVDQLNLREGDRVLDIGCGYGALIAALAQRGARPVGISISNGQLNWAREHHPSHDLRYCDYRHFNEPVDKVVSCEMIEAVGRSHLREYFEKVRSVLPAGGRFVLQAITSNRAWTNGRDSFLETHVFPGGELSRRRDLDPAAEGLFELVEEPKLFAQDYQRTLGASGWRGNLIRAREQITTELQEVGFRMMEFYLGLSEAGFEKFNTVGQYTYVAR